VTEEAWETGVISSNVRVELAADVDRLYAELVGLEVWSREGRLLYADPWHPSEEAVLPAAQLQRALESTPFVSSAEERGVDLLEVFQLPDPSSDGTSDGIAESSFRCRGLAPPSPPAALAPGRRRPPRWCSCSW
jgi:hypothetical protein